MFPMNFSFAYLCFQLRKMFFFLKKKTAIIAEREGLKDSKLHFISVSCFIFLRFFVPSVLGPSLFGMTKVVSFFS